MNSMRPLLGTYVEIRVDEEDRDKAATAINAAFSAIERVQRLMSRFDAGSDVSRLNRECHFRPCIVDPWTLEVIGTAIEIHELSGGAFDCAVTEISDIPAHSTSPPSGLRDVTIVDGMIYSQRPVQFDLGGIAKGFAVDCAIEALAEADVSDACVNAGGDLRVMGACEEAIHIRDPRNPQMLGFAGLLKDGALATSATYYSRYQENGEERSAIVDPRSRRSIVSRDSFTVMAPRCLHADALTKALAVAKDETLPCFSAYGAQTLMIRANP